MLSTIKCMICINNINIKYLYNWVCGQTIISKWAEFELGIQIWNSNLEQKWKCFKTRVQKPEPPPMRWSEVKI